MSDNNLDILVDIETEAFSREILAKTENGALVWSQISQTQFKAIAPNTDTNEFWTYLLNRNPTNSDGQAATAYVLDVLLNNRNYITIANNVTQELYDVLLEYTGRYKRRLNHAGLFLQGFHGSTSYGSLLQISLTGIPSGEAVGTPRMPFGIILTGIPSEEAFGTLNVGGTDNNLRSVDMYFGADITSKGKGTPFLGDLLFRSVSKRPNSVGLWTNQLSVPQDYADFDRPTLSGYSDQGLGTITYFDLGSGRIKMSFTVTFTFSEPINSSAIPGKFPVGWFVHDGSTAYWAGSFSSTPDGATSLSFTISIIVGSME